MSCYVFLSLHDQNRILAVEFQQLVFASLRFSVYNRRSQNLFHKMFLFFYFRKQLKNLMEREHSRMILLTVNPKKYIKICSCFLVFELTFAGFTSYYVSLFIHIFNSIGCVTLLEVTENFWRLSRTAKWFEILSQKFEVTSAESLNHA